MRRAVSLCILFSALSLLLLLVLGTRITGLPPMGVLLDPADGLYRTARRADAPPLKEIVLPGLAGSVEVKWDDRRVPHIFAERDLDAVAVMGYVVARDRLFQLDFIPRAGSGRLAEALGPAALPADRFLRSTGMDWGARRNLDRIRAEGGPELDLMEAYCRGVNAYLERVSDADLPFEFRLLGYRPDPCTPLQALRVLQYMSYDLSFASDDPAYSILRSRLSGEAYDLLYPASSIYSVPIIPSSSVGGAGRGASPAPTAGISAPPPRRPSVLSVAPPPRGSSALSEGFMEGKGSNNWAVTAERSTTGAPILAGDMHLSVTLPAIWYEVHLVTPTMNVYGVTVPGAPVPVEAFTSRTAWAFTNTGSDQIDHYRLDVDESDLTYAFEGARRRLTSVLDTIRVQGEDPVIDTLYYAHWGPASRRADGWVALQWTAHRPSHTLQALWEMSHAQHHADFQEALRLWDTPMQNILYADVDGMVSIRSTGHAPIRAGGTGAGLLDGASSSGEWTGRIPFDELPYSVNPERGYLTSTNQQPTGASYPYYLGHDWGRAYRSIRIDSLLRATERHSPEDLARYQADVHAVQRDFFVPLLDTLAELDGRAEELRRILAGWDGETALDRSEPIAFHFFLEALHEATWDEESFAAQRTGARGEPLRSPVRVPQPDELRIYELMTRYPDASWLDMQGTPERERASDVLRAALERAAQRIEERYGWGGERWRWGERHGIRFDHLVSALEPLGRGPFPYPGYDATLSPASDTLARHSASWRMVVDLSGEAPKGRGVYPGGQSGDPFSRYYDLHLPTYLDFRQYELLKPNRPSELSPSRTLYRSVFEAPRP